MNCQEVLSRLYEIIDKEASEIDAKVVQGHLDRCRHCFEVYRLETAIQDFINAKLRDGNRPGNLETLKLKILVRLNEIDIQRPSPENRPFFKRSAALLVAAASLVILIGAAFWAHSIYRHQTTYAPLERAHLVVAGNPGSVENNPGTFSTVLGVRDNLGYEIHTAVAGFALVGGKTKQIMGVEMAHFVYSQDNQTVSVFVVPNDRFEIPADLKESRVMRNQITFYDHHCRGCRLVYHEAAAAVIITTTTDRSIELLDFIPGYAAI